MKAIKNLALCALALSVLFSCSNMTSNEKRPSTISSGEVKKASYMLGHNFGQFIQGNKMGALDINQIVKGIKDACKGVEVDQEEFMQVMDEYMKKMSEALKEANIAEAEKFFEKNAKDPDVKTTESGLQYKVIRAGNGVYPTSDDTVEVNYEGTLLDGTVFDSSYERGEPATFGLSQVIKGWSEGMQLIDEGGEICLWLPYDLAYGEYGAGGKIGPFQALKFKVELNKIVKPEVEESEKN